MAYSGTNKTDDEPMEKFTIGKYRVFGEVPPNGYLEKDIEDKIRWRLENRKYEERAKS